MFIFITPLHMPPVTLGKFRPCVTATLSRASALLLQCVKADLYHAPCAAASAAKTAADQLPTPAAPALPSPAPQAAQALKDTVPDLSAIFRDAVNGGKRCAPHARGQSLCSSKARCL